MRKPWADRDGSGRGGRPWRRIRERVLKRDGYLCQPCRRKGRLTPAAEVHHVKALSQGGTDDDGNLLSMCSDCHGEADAANRGHKAPRKVGLDGYPLD